MKEEITVCYLDSSDEGNDLDLCDYLVTWIEDEDKMFVTIGADTFNESALGVSITMTRERWLNIVKGVQEVIDSYDKEKNHGT